MADEKRARGDSRLESSQPLIYASSSLDSEGNNAQPVASLSAPPPSLDDEKFRKYGSWDGVWVRVVCSIFGVLMFLRMAWVLGQAGLFLSILIILLSVFVTITTTISMTALCTNGRMAGGGPYYLVSRSAGPELGATFGFLLPFSQTLAVALNCIGFAETVKYLYSSDGYMTPGGDWDVVIIALLADLGCLICCLPGLDWLNKTNAFLLFIILGGVFSFLIGSVYFSPGHNDGFTGWSSSSMENNLGPSFSDGYTFFSVLGVYFPSVTGIMTGVSLSGELKNPARNIPEGTLAGIFFTTCVYIFICIVNAAIGNRTDLKDTNNYYFMADVAIVPALVHAGVFAASLSTAISLLSGAPRIFAAVLRDGYAQPLGIFSKVNERGDPVWGYCLCWGISSIVCFIGYSSDGLNLISKYVSQIYMVCYGLVNFSCYYASAAKTPGWRPMFRYYNKWYSLVGTLVCLGYLFLMDWPSGLGILAGSIVLYKWIDLKSTKLDLGAAGESLAYWRALNWLRKLQKHRLAHVKNFRPQILVLRCFAETSILADISIFFYKCRGVVVVGDVQIGSLEEAARNAGQIPPPVALTPAGAAAQPQWGERLVLFRKVVTTPNLRLGVSTLMATAGLGKLLPNTIFMDFLEGWRDRSEVHQSEYVDIIRDISAANFCTAIFRHPEKILQEEEKSGNIDVYWLRDDGGLQLLLPAILLRHSRYEKTHKLRVFAPHREDQDQDEELKELQKLIVLIRIRAEAFIISADSGATLAKAEKSHHPRGAFEDIQIMEQAQKSLYTKKREFAFFEEIDTGSAAPLSPTSAVPAEEIEITPSLDGDTKAETGAKDYMTGYSPSLRAEKDYFSGYLSAIKTNSSQSTLTFISLPSLMPGVNAKTYLQALDELTSSLPASVLVRGNKQNVVTALL